MSNKPPADPQMERGATPVRPAAPPPRKPAPPPPKQSGFSRFMLQFLLLVIALGGAFGTGYLVSSNETQLQQNDLLQQQVEAKERILVLEQQIAELRESRETGNRVELDLTEVFEPIREAVGRIALVRMGEISRELTTELTRLVETDLPPADEAPNADGAPAPGLRDGMNNGDLAGGTGETEAAAAAGGSVAPQSGSPPEPPQPDSAALDAAEEVVSESAVGVAGGETAVTEASAAEQPVAAVASPAARADPTGIAELLRTPRPPGAGGAPPTPEP